MDVVQGTHMILNEVFKTTSTTRATGFLGGDCTLTGGDELAFNVNFNIPNTTFANTGSTSGTIATVTTNFHVSSGAGRPAKNRGLWFDGSMMVTLKYLH